MATQKELLLQKRKLELELELAEAEEDIPAEAVSPTPSTLSSALTGAQEGVSLGLAPRIAGAAASLGTLTGGGDWEAAKAAYEEGKAMQLAEQEAASAAHPVAYGTGLLGGSVFVPGSSAKVLIGQGAVSGASSADDLLSTEALKGAALGGSLGAAGKALSGAVGSAVDTVRPGVEKLAAYLKSKAGGLAESAAGLDRTLSQRAALEAQLAKGKISEGEIGQKLLEDKIVTPLASSKTITQRLMTARKEAGDELGAILKANPDGVQPELIAQRLRDRANALEDTGSDRALKEEILKLAEQYIPSGMTPHGATIPATKAQEFKMEAGRNVADWQNATRDPQAMLNRDIDSALKESLGAEQAAAYAKANEELSTLIPASEASAKQTAADAMKKTLSVGASPAIALGYGVYQGDPVAGIAAGAAFRLAQKRGPQVVAGNVYNFAKVLEKAPDRLKPVIQKALERGGSSPAITHYLLQQKDPEYNKATTDEEE